MEDKNICQVFRTLQNIAAALSSFRTQHTSRRSTAADLRTPLSQLSFSQNHKNLNSLPAIIKDINTDSTFTRQLKHGCQTNMNPVRHDV